MIANSVNNTAQVQTPWIDWLPPLAVSIVGLFSTAWLMFFAGVGTVGKPVALVFPPNWDRSQSFAGAASLDVSIVEVRSNGALAVVVPRTNDALNHFRSSGALLALNAGAQTLCR